MGWLFDVTVITLPLVYFLTCISGDSTVAKARQFPIFENTNFTQDISQVLSQTDHECFESYQRGYAICTAREWGQKWTEYSGNKSLYCCAGKPVIYKVVLLYAPLNATQPENVVNTKNQPEFECFSIQGRRDGLCAARGWSHKWTEYSRDKSQYWYEAPSNVTFCCAASQTPVPEKTNITTRNNTKVANQGDFECFKNLARRDGICEARGWNQRWIEFLSNSTIYCCAGRRECSND